jgi:hypothetical protein
LGEERRRLQPRRRQTDIRTVASDDTFRAALEDYLLKLRVAFGNAVPLSRDPEIHSALIDGQTVTFASPREKFDALVVEWRRLRDAGSSIDDVVNDAYGQIVSMGYQAVPFLLREASRQSGHWFTALKWITGQNVVTPEMRGNLRAIRRAWLKWGTENGYAIGDSAGAVVQEISAEPSRSHLQVHKQVNV